MADWYYVRQGQRLGPVADDTLRKLIDAAEIGAADLVWTAGMATWQPAGQVEGLMPGGSPLPPLPQQPMAIAYATPAPRSERLPSLGDDAAMRFLLPVGRSGWAIAAGYLGLCSVLLVPAPFAVICALLAIRQIHRDRSKHGYVRAVFGLLMGIVFTIVLGLVLFAPAVLRHVLWGV